VPTRAGPTLDCFYRARAAPEGRGSALPIGLFQAEEMDVAAGVPGRESISDECTAISSAIECRCDIHLPRLHIPCLRSLVILRAKLPAAPLF